jgi:hypothetical protein
MSDWPAGSRGWWLLLVSVGWCSGVLSGPELAGASPRATKAAAPARAKKSPVRDCELWPPRGFPRITDIYALKLEYDCRNRAIAHQRHDLARQEAKQSTELAEKQDLAGIDQKNKWAAQQQSDIETRQRELDHWRDEVFLRLQLIKPLGDADQAVSATTQ